MVCFHLLPAVNLLACLSTDLIFESSSSSILPSYVVLLNWTSMFVYSSIHLLNFLCTRCIVEVDTDIVRDYETRCSVIRYD